jgi:hypothetical protein
MILALKMEEEITDQGMWVSLKAGRGKKTNFPPTASSRKCNLANI